MSDLRTESVDLPSRVLSRADRGVAASRKPSALARLTLRRESIVVALAALTAFAAYTWASWFWIDLIDEGYFLYLASRVYEGALPYRDFDTYYTPGIFYLYAAAFQLFEVSVIPVRILMAGVRVACGLLLYRLTRRVAPWPFAVLPFLAVAGVDPTPILPEPHPAWVALLATLLTLELIARHHASGRIHWVALAGAAAGLAFLFKQNVGAFAALAVGGYVLLRPRDPTGRLLLAVRALFAVALVLVVTVFLSSALNVLVAVTLWLPLVATLVLVLWCGRPAACPGSTAGLEAALTEGVLAGAAFLTVTLFWLIPLIAALGPGATPFGLFLGAVNQGALILPLEPPPAETRFLAPAAIWLPLGLATLLRRPAARPGWGVVGSAVVVSLLALLMPIPGEMSEPLPDDPTFYPWLQRLETDLGTLYLYLPALGAWAGLAVLLFCARCRRPLGLPSWYLLGGTLAALAMYPRLDVLHALFAGAPLFVVGAWALSVAHRALIGGAALGRRAAVFAALLVVPAAAVAPHAYWRYVTVAHGDPRSAEPPPYVPLGLERAPVLVPRHKAVSIRGAVEFVRQGTPPGEPLFAYPAVPLFNFLADRPNPTRFDHFLAGALTPHDLAEVIRSLEAARPRYVVWDHGGVVYWGVDTANRPLSDYIWRCYRQVADFPPYLILERQAC